MADIQDTQIDGDDDEQATLPAGPAAPAPALNPLVQAHIQKLAAQKSQSSDDADDSSDAEDLQAAQKTASMNQLIAGLARAGGTLAHSAYGATAPMDESGFNALDKNAQAPVQDILAQQKAQASDLENESAERQADLEKAKNDPASPQSQTFRNIVKSQFPKIAEAYGADFDKITANDAPTITKIADTKAQIDQRSEAAKDRATALMVSAGSRVSNQQDQAQLKAYTLMRKDLESFRGNQSAQQAALAVQNGQKALALTNSAPTSQNLSLLADEMGKIATGGVPGEHGTQALLPNNLNTKLAEMKSFISSNPVPAKVQKYLDSNRDYIKQVMDISNQSLRAYRSNIAKGYRGRVSPENYQEVSDDYGLSGSGSWPGAQSAGGGSQGASAQYTPDVTSYAQAHGISNDQALAIKNKRTQGNSSLVMGGK